MDHLVQPLETLRGRAMAWLADGRARVLAVSADPELADGARALLASLEWAPDNRRPFFDLRGADWSARAAELRAHYDARRGAFAREAVVLPELPPAPVLAGGGDALGAFARDLTAVARALDDPQIGTRGVVILFSPDAPLEARALVGARGLEEVRWIWIDAAAAPAPSAATGEGTPGGDHDDPMWSVACRIDRAAQKRDTDDFLAATIAAVASGAGGPPGGARPKAAPPPHPGDPRAAKPSPAGDRAGSAPPAAAPPHLHPMLLGIQALRASDAAQAVQRFREARDAATEAGAEAEAVEMELMLASTGAGLALEKGLPFPSVAPLFETAAARAEAAGLLAIATKTRFLLGMSAAGAGEIEIAARALLAAAELAQRDGAPIMRFHALRAAGDLATRAGLRARAAELLREALDVVRGMEPAQAHAAGLADTAAEIEHALRAAGTPAGPRAAAPGDVSP